MKFEFKTQIPNIIQYNKTILKRIDINAQIQEKDI